MWKTTSVVAIAAIVLAGLGSGTRGLDAAPSRGTPAEALFDHLVDGQSAGIYEGNVGANGPLFSDNVDGVTCWINSGNTEDFLLNIGTFGSPPKPRNPRTMYFDLRWPATAPASYGEFVTKDVHLNVRDVGTFATVGSSGTTFAGFRMSLNGVEHRLRYGFVDGDGTARLQVTRDTATTWEIRTPPGNGVAKLWKITKSGDLDLGNYHVPLKIILTVK